MKKQKYKKYENKYIEWLENNMNKYNLFYFKERSDQDDTIECRYLIEDSLHCTFSKLVIDQILGRENNPNI